MVQQRLQPRVNSLTRHLMKTICCILVLSLGTLILHAGPPHWQNEDELLLWIHSKDTLEITEYVEVWESLRDWNPQAPIKANNEREIAKTAWQLIFKKFSSHLHARDFDRVSEIFEGVCGYHHGVNTEMMNALTDCTDVEFVAQVVHRSLNRISWDNARGFSLPIINSRRKLFDKIMGESETYEMIYSKYRGMDRLTQDALKNEIEKKWPVLLEENTREPKWNTQISEPPHDKTEQPDSPQGNPIDPAATDSKIVRLLLIAGVVLLAFAILIASMKRR